MALDVTGAQSEFASEGVTYRWRGPLADAEMVELVNAHGGRAATGWWDRIRPHSLGWVTARESDGALVGFVNVATDGADHAFLLDTKTHGRYQHKGIGTRVVRLAALHAKAAGCEWLHVDFEAGLDTFYLEACGFRPTAAGLIHLPSSVGAAADLPDSTRLGPGERWLELSYDAYPRIEEAFHAALDTSLHPRGPELLYDLVQDMGLSPGSLAVDVGCGEGKHSLELAERFQFTVTGLDPVPRHVELASAELAAVAALRAEGRRVRFELGTADALPLEDRTVDLIWCRDVLVHVADLDKAYAEFQRVLRPSGRVLIYQMFGTDRLEPREAEWFWRTMGVVPASADRARAEGAISAAGLRIDDCIHLGSEWGEWAEEQSGKTGRRLLYASRLLRDPQRYIAQFGQAAYEIMLGDCLWHVYAMIGKLERRVYLLSKI